MSDLISRKALIHKFAREPWTDYSKEAVIRMINDVPIAYDVDGELRILKNYLYHKPKTYRERNYNFVVVRDLLMNGTSTSGMTSCIMKCRELGIDPYGYELKGAVKDE